MKSLKLTKTFFLLTCFGVLPAFANDPFIPKSMFLDEFPYPFKPQPIDVPDLVLNTIQNTDILFLGEKHIHSVFLAEKHSNQKTEFNSHRLNSLNQENIYFHFIDRFSKIHKTAKKCLWLEYDSNDPDIENILKGLRFSVSHYYLINTAKELGWKVFFVDNRDLPPFSLLRDEFMSKQIAQTIKDGHCEKGIAQNGRAHLSGYKDYPKRHDLIDREKFLNELVKIELENLNLDKRIDFFIMKSWSEIQILRTREDVLSAYQTGQRDFLGWNLQGADLKEALLARAYLREANLYETDLTMADMTGANLQVADLRFANLRFADLKEADLRFADLRRAYLYGTNLKEALLARADLRGANFTGANFTGANLVGADLRRADLQGADLRGANLRGANLRFADLRRADLRFAGLLRADLIMADLRFTDLRGADLRFADLREADLRDAKYNNQTKFPDNFDSETQGMIFISE